MSVLTHLLPDSTTLSFKSHYGSFYGSQFGSFFRSSHKVVFIPFLRALNPLDLAEVLINITTQNNSQTLRPLALYPFSGILVG